MNALPDPDLVKPRSRPFIRVLRRTIVLLLRAIKTIAPDRWTYSFPSPFLDTPSLTHFVAKRRYMCNSHRLSWSHHVKHGITTDTLSTWAGQCSSASEPVGASTCRDIWRLTPRRYLTLSGFTLLVSDYTLTVSTLFVSFVLWWLTILPSLRRRYESSSRKAQDIDSRTLGRAHLESSL